jgi:Hydantoinase B/oxoprolinase
MTQTRTLSAITLQVMWNRLISVVEEQAQTLIRTAFSTSTREAGDVSAGVFDVQGRMLAQAVDRWSRKRRPAMSTRWRRRSRISSRNIRSPACGRATLT